MARFFKILIALPVAVVLVALAIANRQVVTVSFDPFVDPAASAAVVTAPLFVLLFLALIVGTFLGGVASWLRQGVNRRRARHARDEAQRLRAAPPVMAAPSGGRALAPTRS